MIYFSLHANNLPSLIYLDSQRQVVSFLVSEDIIDIVLDTQTFLVSEDITPCALNCTHSFFYILNMFFSYSFSGLRGDCRFDLCLFILRHTAAVVLEDIRPYALSARTFFPLESPNHYCPARSDIQG